MKDLLLEAKAAVEATPPNALGGQSKRCRTLERHYDAIIAQSLVANPPPPLPAASAPKKRGRSVDNRTHVLNNSSPLWPSV